MVFCCGRDSILEWGNHVEGAHSPADAGCLEKLEMKGLLFSNFAKKSVEEVVGLQYTPKQSRPD